MKSKLFVVAASLFLLSTAPQAAPLQPSKPETQVVHKININTATLDSLTHSVKGIGLKRAEAIIHYREKNGVFKSIAQLAQVKGFSEHYVNEHLTQLQQTFSFE